MQSISSSGLSKTEQIFYLILLTKLVGLWSFHYVALVHENLQIVFFNQQVERQTAQKG